MRGRDNLPNFGDISGIQPDKSTESIRSLVDQLQRFPQNIDFNNERILFQRNAARILDLAQNLGQFIRRIGQGAIANLLSPDIVNFMITQQRKYRNRKYAQDLGLIQGSDDFDRLLRAATRYNPLQFEDLVNNILRIARLRQANIFIDTDSAIAPGILDQFSRPLVRSNFNLPPNIQRQVKQQCIHVTNVFLQRFAVVSKAAIEGRMQNLSFKQLSLITNFLDQVFRSNSNIRQFLNVKLNVAFRIILTYLQTSLSNFRKSNNNIGNRKMLQVKRDFDTMKLKNYTPQNVGLFLNNDFYMNPSLRQNMVTIKQRTSVPTVSVFTSQKYKQDMMNKYKKFKDIIQQLNNNAVQRNLSLFQYCRTNGSALQQMGLTFDQSKRSIYVQVGGVSKLIFSFPVSDQVISRNFALLNQSTYSKEKIKQLLPQEVVQLIKSAQVVGLNPRVGPISKNGRQMFIGVHLDPVSGKPKLPPKPLQKHLNPSDKSSVLEYKIMKYIYAWNQKQKTYSLLEKQKQMTDKQWLANVRKKISNTFNTGKIKFQYIQRKFLEVLSRQPIYGVQFNQSVEYQQLFTYCDINRQNPDYVDFWQRYQQFINNLMNQLQNNLTQPNSNLGNAIRFYVARQTGSPQFWRNKFTKGLVKLQRQVNNVDGLIQTVNPPQNVLNDAALRMNFNADPNRNARLPVSQYNSVANSIYLRSGGSLNGINFRRQNVPLAVNAYQGRQAPLFGRFQNGLSNFQQQQINRAVNMIPQLYRQQIIYNYGLPNYLNRGLSIVRPISRNTLYQSSVDQVKIFSLGVARSFFVNLCDLIRRNRVGQIVQPDATYIRQLDPIFVQCFRSARDYCSFMAASRFYTCPMIPPFLARVDLQQLMIPQGQMNFIDFGDIGNRLRNYNIYTDQPIYDGLRPNPPPFLVNPVNLVFSENANRIVTTMAAVAYANPLDGVIPDQVRNFFYIDVLPEVWADQNWYG